MFSEWLVEEAYYLRTFLQLSHIYTAFHYSSEIYRKNQRNPTRKGNVIIHNSYKNRTTIHWNNRFVWIQSNLHFSGHAERVKMKRRRRRRRRKYIIKLSLAAADALQQIICTIKIRRAPVRHDSK